ncbi:MAG: hypothetical protein ABIH11_05490 [Candidatus Altiarchaeota archaeon]
MDHKCRLVRRAQEQGSVIPRDRLARLIEFGPCGPADTASSDHSLCERLRDCSWEYYHRLSPHFRGGTVADIGSSDAIMFSISFLGNGADTVMPVDTAFRKKMPERPLGRILPVADTAYLMESIPDESLDMAVFHRSLPAILGTPPIVKATHFKELMRGSLEMEEETYDRKFEVLIDEVLKKVKPGKPIVFCTSSVNYQAVPNGEYYYNYFNEWLRNRLSKMGFEPNVEGKRTSNELLTYTTVFRG